MTKVKDDEVMNEQNVHRFVRDAIKSYFDKHMIVDGMFWREAIRLIMKKHNIKEL